MPTNRTPVRRATRRRFSAKAIEAYQRRDWAGLYAALDWKPWLPNLLDVDGEEPPTWMDDEQQQLEWREAWRLRCELEKAAKK